MLMKTVAPNLFRGGTDPDDAAVKVAALHGLLLASSELLGVLHFPVVLGHGDLHGVGSEVSLPVLGHVRVWELPEVDALTAIGS